MGNPAKTDDIREFAAELVGDVNGHPVEVVGRGVLDEGEGIVSGYYEIVQFPPGIDPRILITTLVTGYPNCTKDHRYFQFSCGV